MLVIINIEIPADSQPYYVLNRYNDLVNRYYDLINPT